MNIIPCNNCEERSAYCHAHCKRYADWSKENVMRREEIHKKKEIEHGLDSQERKRSFMIKKKMGAIR